MMHTHQTRHHQRSLESDYLWQGVFETKEQVDAYFAGDKIQCLLCGKWYKQLSSTHLTRKHGMTPDEYRERYRLPYLRGLVGQVTSAKHSRNARRLQAEGKLWRSPKGHIVPYDRSTGRRQPFLSHPKWQRKDYEAILARMQAQQRGLHDVCRDPDLPGKTSWGRFVARHPEYAERAKQIYAGFPYAVQARLCCKLPPQFIRDCRRLQAQCLSYQKIADTLGVGCRLVARHLEPLPPPRKWQHKDYEAVLSRIQAQQRSLKDVLDDPDLPGQTSWKTFVAQHPEFAARVTQIYAEFPYAVQARIHCTLPPEFTRDCQRLQAQCLSHQKIARTLGVGRKVVARHLTPLPLQRKWQRKDYEAVLSRMQAQQRSLHDVCNDPDLPCEVAWRKFTARHPEFAARVKQIYTSWPYAVQGKLLRELSPQFTVDCRRLRAQGLSYQKIAEALGVGIRAVVRHLKKPVQP